MGKLSAYCKRNAILESLGFSSYASYLESDLWFRIRRRVMDQHGRRCFRCKADATEVHHISYSKQVLTGDNLNGMVAICRECHAFGEFDENQVKMSLEQANYRLGIAVAMTKSVGKKAKKKKGWGARPCVGPGCKNSAGKGKTLCKRCQKIPVSKRVPLPGKPGSCAGCFNMAKKGKDLCRCCQRRSAIVRRGIFEPMGKYLNLDKATKVDATVAGAAVDMAVADDPWKLFLQRKSKVPT